MNIAILRCPNCYIGMREVQKYGIDLFYCPVCRGVWLDRDEINKIEKVQNQYEFEYYERYRRGKVEYDDNDDYYGRKRSRGFLVDLFELRDL
jgi:hypothetical protein